MSVRFLSPAVLVVGPSWVGDMVMAQSLCKVLRREHPKLAIDMLAPAWCAGLVQRMAEVRQTIPLDINHGEWAWGKRRTLGHQLRANQYQQAIVLPNSFKSALIPWWAKIPKRTGYSGEMRLGLLNDRRALDRSVLTQTVERFAALGFPPEKATDLPYIPRPSLESSQRQTERALQRLEIPMPEQPVLALCPGAEYGPAKQWPAESFAQVATQVVDKGWQVWLMGSQHDALIAEAIMALQPACLNLCGQTTLEEAVDLLALSRAVVSNDSGLMHIAAALDKPLVALFGSSDPQLTPPLSPHAQIINLRLPCAPCFKRTCPRKHLQCLRDITPQMVIERLPPT